nr:hypothetical protein [Armatimonadota bacterium]NIM22766.1 hypothetical protein [Armatimonadota bacterium]NIM66598.1 hypothetical protein [Armatimonadota bacterium]NIN04822.1 hypothetical protein [Armatimonadota bacterium]NIO95683.1 hypothetical protein [Armatimonadota bacterium]
AALRGTRQESRHGLPAENDVDDFTEKIDRLLTDPKLTARPSARAVGKSAWFCRREMALRALEVYQSVGNLETE